MPLNFPNSPSLNDFFVAGGRRWQWNGTAWQRIPDPGAQGVQGSTCLLYTSDAADDW